MTEPYTLKRDGQRPLALTGTLLAEAHGHDYAHEPTRWYDLAVYQTTNGRLVVAWEYQSQWQGESNHYRAEDVLNLASVATLLEDFTPCAWLIAYRPLIERSAGQAEHYATRQAQVERALTTAYQAQVRDLCATLGITEHLA